MIRDYKNEIVDFIKFVCEEHQIVIIEKIVNKALFGVHFPDMRCAVKFHSISNEPEEVQSINSDALNKPIKTVHIWEDQWKFHNEKIVSKIKSLIGITKRIHGRKTEVTSIDNDILLEFLDNNHLHVPIKGKYKYGLVEGQQLVAVMSFSKGRMLARDNVDFYSFELLRFCSQLGVTVVGGFSKLLNHFIKTQNPDDVMTYVDCDWSDGQSFLALGFELSERMPSMEFWLNSKTGVREYPHIALKKHEKTMVDLSSDSKKESFLKKHGYKKVYNSGSYKFILKRKKVSDKK